MGCRSQRPVRLMQRANTYLVGHPNCYSVLEDWGFWRCMLVIVRVSEIFPCSTEVGLYLILSSQNLKPEPEICETEM